jgi:hypothetical protein
MSISEDVLLRAKFIDVVWRHPAQLSCPYCSLEARPTVRDVAVDNRTPETPQKDRV